MGFFTKTLTSSATGTYGPANEIIGQVKALLLDNAPAEIITVISDNNPVGGTVARVLDLKLGTSLHYFRLTATTTGSGYSELSIRNLANTANLSTSGNCAINNSFVKAVLGSNGVIINFYSSVGTFGAIKLVDGSWVSFYNSTPYDNASDTARSFTSSVYYGQNVVENGTNKLPLVKAGMLIGALLYLTVNSWHVYSSLVIKDNTYSDGTLSYYALNTYLLIGE